MIKARIIDGKLVDALCSDYINLECENYYRVDGKSSYEKIGNCGSKFYQKKSKIVAVGVSLSKKEVEETLNKVYQRVTIISYDDNKEVIAKSEGLQDIISQLPSLIKYELQVTEVVSNCVEVCVC